jgi:hypothetical protein
VEVKVVENAEIAQSQENWEKRIEDEVILDNGAEAE